MNVNNIDIKQTNASFIKIYFIQIIIRLLLFMYYMYFRGCLLKYQRNHENRYLHVRCLGHCFVIFSLI